MRNRRAAGDHSDPAGVLPGLGDPPPADPGDPPVLMDDLRSAEDETMVDIRPVPGEPEETPLAAVPPEAVPPPAGEEDLPPGSGGIPPGPEGPAVPGEPPPGPPRAGRGTTIALIAGLFVAIVVTGVLGTIAVLMTREPDLPLGADPPSRLATPIHFAPVTGVRAAPCPGAEAVLDDAGTTCYQVARGVTVTSVVRISTVAAQDGTYAVRVVPAPDSRARLADLIKDTLNQQLAVVVDDKVVTAPRVAQPMTQDSLSIAGLSKETAEALMSRLLGGVGTVTGSGAPTPTPSCPPTGVPGTGTTGDPGTGTTGDPGTGTTGNPGTGTTGNPGTGTTGDPGTGTTGTPGTGTTGGQGTGGTIGDPGAGTVGGSPVCPPTAATTAAPPPGGVTTGVPSGPPATGVPSAPASQPGSVPLVPPGATHTPGTGTGATPAGKGAQPAGSASPHATGVSARGPRRTLDPRFSSCKQAHAANYGPYTKGVHPEYDWYVDGDHDGVACERGDIT
ncbi:excalibur calcium-binding domain-containing protein [Sphaerisporangium sp. NPDC005289]|uniref:excalibur calcium-binding domain-containing protein n=1 Tax=Sphaerisporangium sp. NPDC005289 TaxID=3155247 RepID=UPI0033B0F2C9